MDKTTYEKLNEIVSSNDEETAVIAAEKLLALDLSDIANTTKLINETLGKGDVGGRIGDGTSISMATFGEFTAEAKTYPMAILKLIVMAVKAKSLDKFFGEGGPKKEKKSNAGLGAAPERSLGMSRY